MKELRQAIKRERRGKLSRVVLLQHDNARPHVSSMTVAAIRELGLEYLSHPPYSPDLTSSDYWLFGEMKRPLRGKRFPNFKVLDCQIKQWEKGTPKEFYATWLERLPERCKRRVDLKGEYVEWYDDEFI